MKIMKKMKAAKQELDNDYQDNVSAGNLVNDADNNETTVETNTLNTDSAPENISENSNINENSESADITAAIPSEVFDNPVFFIDNAETESKRGKKLHKKSKISKRTSKSMDKPGKHRLKKLFDHIKELITYANEKTLPLRRQIRFKLVVAFAVPVLFLLILGIYSYQSSKGTIVGNYKNSAKVSIENSSLYVNLLMDDIETRASQLAGETSFLSYYATYDTLKVSDASELYDESKDKMVGLKNSSVGIYSIYAFGSKGTPMTTMDKSIPDGIYKDFNTSEEIAKWKSLATMTGGATSAWIGNHPTLDNAASASTDYYAASYVRTIKGDGYIVVDLVRDKIENLLEKDLVSKNSMTIFVTADGRETIVSKKSTDNLKSIVAGQSFYKKAVSDKKDSNIMNVKYNGKDYVFVYSKIGSTGSMICTMIPKSDIMAKLNGTRIITFLMVIISCLVAFFIGLILATDIAKVLSRFSKTFKQVSAGDFTIRINTKRKDEFGLLALDTDDMINKIQELVADMANFGHNVSNAATKVSGASQEILSSVNEVSETVNVMNQGVSEQAKDTEKSFLQMTDFAGQIGEASNGFLTVGQVADKTQRTVSGGKDIIDKLMQQVTATSEVTSVIIKDIDELQVQSKNIGSVVETINSIASTTNLLSLNASIEAARAGDAGRGFAVVADQIRSLAEQSVESVKRIEKIIKTIQQKTQVTVASAKNAEQLLGSQTDALNNTVQVFTDVDQHMLNLMEKINQIMKNMETISVSKDDVLDAIKNIAAVTEETLASSEVVSTNINTQITAVETLNVQAEEMADKAKDLEEAINRFKIN